MKTLVTGAKGFIGKNLCVALKRAGVEIAEIDADAKKGEMRAGLAGAGIVFHLAGVNRPDQNEDFEAGNVESLRLLLACVEDLINEGRAEESPAIVLSSSIQAEQDNPYGRSKLAGEKLLEQRFVRTGAPSVIYRLPGVFGKWCRPDYNSVVATFCHNIARDLPVTISDPFRTVTLVHVDDVVAQFMTHLQQKPEGLSHGKVQPAFRINLGDLAGRIRQFRAVREGLEISDISDPLTYRLLGTFASYLPPGDLAYPLKQNADARGTLVEILKSPRFGQIFVSRTRPGIMRGNHYHDLKVEKFCVLEGEARIRFRSILGCEIIEHCVSGSDFKVVDIPPGMTHSIENVGRSELIVLFWASAMLDHQHPDTYFSEVVRG